MRELRSAFPRTIPVLFGYIFLGITYGILMVTSGLPVFLPVMTAAVIYTGSMEFLLVDILLSSFNPASALVTALMVGARHIFYGLSMLSKYRGTGKAKFYLIYTTSDETFALNYDAVIPKGCDRMKYYFFVSFLDQLYWICGAAIGALAGSFITVNTEGLDFVMTAMFVCIFLNQWVKDSDEAKKSGLSFLHAHAPEIIGVAGSLVCLLIFGPDHFIIPSMIVILLILTLARKTLERPGSKEEMAEPTAGDAGKESVK